LRFEIGAARAISTVPATGRPPDNARMSTLLLILLVLLILGAFGSGLARPAYRGPGISVGAILLIILLLWMFGVFGSRPF
jgi:uncharacterized membrane protein YoaK (UPF0700 family)